MPLIKATYCTSLPVHPSCLHSSSSQLFTAVGAGTNLWLLGITSPSLPFGLPFFPSTEPSSKSLPSSLIPLFLLHRHNASSTQTSHRHRGDLSCRSSISESPTLSRSCRMLVVVQDTSSSGQTIETPLLPFFALLTMVKTYVVYLVQRDKVSGGYKGFVEPCHSWSLLCVFGGEIVQCGTLPQTFYERFCTYIDISDNVISFQPG